MSIPAPKQPGSITSGGHTSASLKRKAVSIDSGSNKRTKILTSRNASDIDTPTATIASGSGHRNITADRRTIFPFLSLPAEVRIMVYRLLLHLDRPIYPRVEGSLGSVRGSKFPKGLVLAMALANKQLSEETTHFLYSNNCFKLTTSRHSSEWLCSIGLQNSSLIQEVIVLCPDVSTVKQTNELLRPILLSFGRCARNLTQLTVHGNNTNYCRGASPIRSLRWFDTRYSLKKKFPNLQHVTVKTGDANPPQQNERQWYDKFFQRSGLSVTAIHRVCAWSDIGQGFHADWAHRLHHCTEDGKVWLSLTPAALEKGLDATLPDGI